MKIPPKIYDAKDKGKKYEIDDDDLEEVIEVPRVVSWRKCRLWTRYRETKIGDIIETRVLTVDKKTQRIIAKGYVLDKQYNQKDFQEVLRQGFHCCFCDKNFHLTDELLLEPIEREVEPVNAFNILCGKCWGGGKSPE